MTQRLSLWLIGPVALVVALVLLGVGYLALRPAGPLLREAQFSLTTISPNADGLDDITRIDYVLSRPATVSIYFLDADGNRYDFRLNRPRESGRHTLLFSGVVRGYTLPTDDLQGDVLERVLADGEYTWVIEAVNADEQMQLTGLLTVREADTTLPDLRGFSVFPQTFTPNRDGIDDRTTINVYLSKAADLRVWLVDADGNLTPVPEAASLSLPGEPGLKTYDYEGGVDRGAQPPADGTYIVRALAEDRLGQKVQVESTLTIANGGIPRAEIVNAAVEFSETTVVLGNELTFTLTVENYGTAPIRTTGPASGTVYRFDENANTLGWFDESGAWRIGIDCDTCIRDYPYRWALGTPEELTKIGEYYYLMPGQRVTVTGTIILTEQPPRNPLYFWAGLIHEDVEISNVNNRVDPHLVTIEAP